MTEETRQPLGEIVPEIEAEMDEYQNQNHYNYCIMDPENMECLTHHLAFSKEIPATFISNFPTAVKRLKKARDLYPERFLVVASFNPDAEIKHFIKTHSLIPVRAIETATNIPHTSLARALRRDHYFPFKHCSNMLTVMAHYGGIKHFAHEIFGRKSIHVVYQHYIP